MYRLNYGLEYTVLRYPNVYGPRQDPHGEAGVVAIFTGQMLTGQQVVINGDGDQERDFVYVGDCAQANLMAIQGQSSSGIYNLGCGEGTTVNQVYRVLKEITGYPLEARHAPPKLGETRRIFLNANKATDELGWKPIVELQQGMEKTVAYFRSVEMAA